MNTQYRKNLKAVLEASKTYCDKRIDDLEWQIGTYNYDVATDSNVARIKTLPSDTYKSQIDYIGGKTVKYNQLVRVQSGTKNITAPYGIIYSFVTCDFTHKYFLNVKHSVSFDNLNINFYVSGSGNVRSQQLVGSTSIQAILNPNYSAVGNINCYCANSTDITVSYEALELIDLTDIFGAGNEPSTVETAIPLLKANGYKLDGTDTYSTGSLKHAITTSVKYLPINVWDEEWELGSISSSGVNSPSATQIRSKNYISILPSLTYYFKIGTVRVGRVCFFDINKVIIQDYNMYGNETFTTPNNAYFMRFVIGTGNPAITTYNNDICINISNASYNGNYYPYVAPKILTIPSQVLADNRYGLGFDNTNYNHLDSDGHLRGSWGIIDLGSLSYNHNTSSGREIFSVEIPTLKSMPNTNTPINAICALYEAVAQSATWANMQMSYQYGSTIVFVNNNYTDATTFKTTMSGVYLVYELATAFDQDYSQYFDTNWNKVDLDKLYATCEMVVAEPIDMSNSITNLIKEVKA